MNYTWKITGLKRADSPSLKNIIVQTYWTKTGTDEDGNQGTFQGATPFNLTTVDPDNFIKYEDLTEEMILEWIQKVVVGVYQDHVNEEIQKQIDIIKNNIVEVREDFPWVGIGTTS